MPFRRRPGRLRVLVVLSALTVAVLAGSAPVHADPPEGTPGACIVEKVRGDDLGTQGWKWLSTPCDNVGAPVVTPQGWKWL